MNRLRHELARTRCRIAQALHAHGQSGEPFRAGNGCIWAQWIQFGGPAAPHRPPEILELDPDRRVLQITGVTATANVREIGRPVIGSPEAPVQLVPVAIRTESVRGWRGPAIRLRVVF